MVFNIAGSMAAAKAVEPAGIDYNDHWILSNLIESRFKSILSTPDLRNAGKLEAFFLTAITSLTYGLPFIHPNLSKTLSVVLGYALNTTTILPAELHRALLPSRGPSHIVRSARPGNATRHSAGKATHGALDKRVLDTILTYFNGRNTGNVKPTVHLTYHLATFNVFDMSFLEQMLLTACNERDDDCKTEIARLLLYVFLKCVQSAHPKGHNAVLSEQEKEDLEQWRNMHPLQAFSKETFQKQIDDNRSTFYRINIVRKGAVGLSWGERGKMYFPTEQESIHFVDLMENWGQQKKRKSGHQNMQLFAYLFVHVWFYLTPSHTQCFHTIVGIVRKLFSESVFFIPSMTYKSKCLKNFQLRTFYYQEEYVGQNM
ncbi:hypothetical protein BC829DRAFT_416201 [Chytridium lagenaria]|nr:hypothetical protein BC829DRAFT_416201 [Chytridium lagenaria]